MPQPEAMCFGCLPMATRNSSYAPPIPLEDPDEGRRQANPLRLPSACLEEGNSRPLPSGAFTNPNLKDSPEALDRRMEDTLVASTSTPFWTAAAASGLLFAFLTIAVFSGMTVSFDKNGLLAIRDFTTSDLSFGRGWLTTAARDITALGGDLVGGLVLLGALAFLLVSREAATALQLLAIVLSGRLIGAGLKLLLHRDRPQLVPHGVETYSTSFPSGHALMAVILYGSLAVLLTRDHDPGSKLVAAAFAALLIVLVGGSRVYLGVHWPSDVAAGWLAGLAWTAMGLAVAAQVR